MPRRAIVNLNPRLGHISVSSRPPPSYGVRRSTKRQLPGIGHQVRIVVVDVVERGLQRLRSGREPRDARRVCICSLANRINRIG